MPLKTKAELHQLVDQLYEILKSHDVATCVQLLHTLQTDAVKSCADLKCVDEEPHNDFEHGENSGIEHYKRAILETITEQPL